MFGTAIMPAPSPSLSKVSTTKKHSLLGSESTIDAFGIDHTGPAILNAAPYVHELLAENARGIEALKLCSQVTFPESG